MKIPVQQWDVDGREACHVANRIDKGAFHPGDSKEVTRGGHACWFMGDYHG